MAAAYMIYFGACALNKSHGKQNDIAIEIIEQTIDDKNIITTCKQTFYNDHCSFFNKDITSADSEEVKSERSLITSFFIIRDNIIRTKILAFHLFSRPPPVV